MADSPSTKPDPAQERPTEQPTEIRSLPLIAARAHPGRRTLKGVRDAMAHFMDVHRGMHGITSDQLHQAHQADLAVEKDENVHFEQAWADPASGTIYCLSEGPSAEAVQRVHERAGHKADEIHEVPLSA